MIPLLLQELGFRPYEVHYGETLADGRMVIPAALDGEPARFLLDTTLCTDVSVDIGYAHRKSWLRERINDQWSATAHRSVFALGRPRGESRLAVRGSEDEIEQVYDTAGTLGICHINDGVFAVDPIAAAVGLSEQIDLDTTAPAGGVRIGLLETTSDRIPVTTELVDEYAADYRPRLMIDTSRPESSLSLQYIERSWRGWRGWRRRHGARRAAESSTKIYMRLRLPGGEATWLRVNVFQEPAFDYEHEFGTDVDGFLGLDFLYRWVSVIDFPRATLWLMPLS